MTKVIRYHQTGGPEVMQWEDVDLGKLQPDQVRIKLAAIGLNFIEINTRAGRWGYKPAQLPYIPGLEGAGTITEVGAKVQGFKVGDRVCFASGHGRQAYAEEILMSAESAVPIPDFMDFRMAAATIFKGMTAYMLVKQVRELKPGETVLVHGAAGAVPYFVTQWAKHIGARVIGTVSTDKKAAFAKAHGCDEIINYSKENFGERVKKLTDGKGVDIVYDGIGKDALDGSLAALAVRGMLITYGQTSGLPAKIEVDLLSDKSLFVARPRLHDYVVDKETRRTSSSAAFDMVKQGKIKVEIGSEFALKDAVEAHRERERRTLMGSMLLIAS